MKNKIIPLTVSLCILASATMVATAADGGQAAKHTFTLGTDDFLLDGKPFQIRAGEIDPGRVPPEYWRHSIRMAKAMGLNTIASYIFWNQHEEHEGHFDFTTGARNIGEFFKIAKEEGMWVLLRPGPYICGEWDEGGLPWWLLKTPDIKLRSMDPRYTGPVEKYLHQLAQVIRPCMVENGGPIIMVQIENEYGSYERQDHNYMVWLRDLWVKEGVKGPFSTADGAAEHYLKNTVMPGVAVGLDTGENQRQFDQAHTMNPGVPVFSSEVYPGWLRHWGESNWSPKNISGLLKFYMDAKKSFSLYMFHGGTNFGLTAGSNENGGSITSYDYGAPLNEQGSPTPAYMAIRKQIASYLPPEEKLPDIPASLPAIGIPEFQMEYWSSIWSQMPAPVTSGEPEFFEALGQNQGLVLYRTVLPPGTKGRLDRWRVHDYAQVILNGTFLGTTGRDGAQGVDIPDSGAKPATLDILVEAMGHINFRMGLESDRKGLLAPVKLGSTVLTKWEMYCYPLTDNWVSSLKKTDKTGVQPGGIFKGEFNLDKVDGDTYLDMSAYKKGYVWVNGHNLGRYWSIGPQQRLYCPAPWLKQGTNTVMVLDLDLSEPKPITGFKSPDDEGNPLAGLTVKAEEPAFNIEVPANTVKTKDMPWPEGATIAVAHIDPMHDQGQDWGLGLAVGWADGKYVKINARTDGSWEVRRAGSGLAGGPHTSGKPATVAIKLTNNTIKILAKEDDEEAWRVVAALPRKDFTGNPATIRFGKIGSEWEPRDFADKGASSPCKVDWVKAY